MLAAPELACRAKRLAVRSCLPRRNVTVTGFQSRARLHSRRCRRDRYTFSAQETAFGLSAAREDWSPVG